MVPWRKVESEEVSEHPGSGGALGAFGAFGDEGDDSYVVADERGHRHECGEYVPPDSELRQFIEGLRKEHAASAAARDAPPSDGWGTIYISQRLKDYESHFGRYPTARPSRKQLEGRAEKDGDFLLFPDGQYRWVGKDEKIPNPFAGKGAQLGGTGGASVVPGVAPPV